MLAATTRDMFAVNLPLGLLWLTCAAALIGAPFGLGVAVLLDLVGCWTTSRGWAERSPRWPSPRPS